MARAALLSPSSSSDVSLWHFPDVTAALANVCCGGKNGSQDCVARLPSLTQTDPHHAEPSEISARRKRLQQPSHSLLTPSAILISVRSRSVPEHCAQDANEQQRCDRPMKPDSVQTGEDID